MKLSTSDRLKYLMETRNLRQADILEMIKPYCEKYNVNIPRNALSQYVTGKVLPKQDKLTILGLALNVSEVWLMGYDVPMERTEAAVTPIQKSVKESLTDPERQLLAAFRALNAQGQAMALATVEAYTHTDSLKQDTAPKVG